MWHSITSHLTFRLFVNDCKRQELLFHLLAGYHVLHATFLQGQQAAELKGQLAFSPWLHSGSGWRRGVRGWAECSVQSCVGQGGRSARLCSRVRACEHELLCCLSRTREAAGRRGTDTLPASERMTSKELFPVDCIALLQSPMPSCWAENKAGRKRAQRKTEFINPFDFSPSFLKWKRNPQHIIVVSVPTNHRVLGCHPILLFCCPSFMDKPNVLLKATANWCPLTVIAPYPKAQVPLFPHLLFSLWNLDSFKPLLGIFLAHVTDQYTAGKTLVSSPTSSAVIVTCIFRGSEHCWTDPPSSKAVRSGRNGLIAGLDLVWSIQPPLQIEQFLFLSLLPVNKAISEVCQLGEKWGVGRAREEVSEQHPHRKTHGKGSSGCPFLPSTSAGRGNIPCSFSCCFCLFLLTLSPRSLLLAGSTGAMWHPAWGTRPGTAARDWAALSAAAAELFPAPSPSSPHLYRTVLALFICPSISWFLSAGYCVCEA